MFKTQSKIFSAILALSLILSMMAQPISAANINDENVIQPQWQNATHMVLQIGLENSTIDLKVTVTGYAGTTYKNGTAVLEKISGSNCGTVKTWTGITSGTPILTFTDSSLTRTKGTYRLTFTVTTVRNGKTETISAHKDETC